MASPNFCKSPPFPRPASSFQATASLQARDPGDDLYEGYNDYDSQLHQLYTGSQSQIGLRESFESKTDSVGVYDHVPAYSRSSSASDIQGPAFSSTLTPHTTASMMWRPPSTSMSSRAQYNPYSSTDTSRPMTAVRAAGYSSRGSKFDPMNQASINSTSGAQKEEANPEYQCREMERAVNQLLEASAVASLAILRESLCNLREVQMACGSRETSKQLFRKLRKQARKKGFYPGLGSRRGWPIR